MAPNSFGFLQADVAIATLDTHASNVPTWALLFSPLEGPTHGIVTGYGVNGTSASAQGSGACVFISGVDNCSPLGGIDYRRRAAENMIDALMSLDDRDNFLYGPGNTANPQALYQLDFDSPGGTNQFDFDLFDGAALPNEGTTAGGDSGGPLIVDQQFDRQVVAAVLSGGSRFFNEQRFSTYGTNSFYQPLYLFWEEIVANNSYVYATSKAGSREWTDASHWVQAMDPNYQIIVGGELENALPSFRADGVDGNGPRFGDVCFLDDCFDTSVLSTSLTPTTGRFVVPGGPGSVNFIPNNIDPVNSETPGQTVKARYYDVTLAAIGTTRVSNANIVIDVLTVDGTKAKLDVASTGSLRSLTDFNQMRGWTNVDGLLRANEALFLSGTLSGTGTIESPFTTVIGAMVSPGGNNALGTLTFDGSLILASASSYYVNLTSTANSPPSGSSDRLVVTGALDVGGGLSFNAIGATPRNGDRYTIATAAGGVSGNFNSVILGRGVLQPVITYSANSVDVELRAGRLNTFVSKSGTVSPTALSFATAFDNMRSGYTGNLAGIYSVIDMLDPTTLSAALDSMAPTIVGESLALANRQGQVMLDNVSDRLSLLGTGATGGMNITGGGAMLEIASGQASSPMVGFNAMVPSGSYSQRLPEGLSGFASSGYVSGGLGTGQSSSTVSGRDMYYTNMGLEKEVGSNLTMGFAAGYSFGARSTGALDEGKSSTTQIVGYGAYRFNDSAYVAAMASAESGQLSLRRTVLGEYGGRLDGKAQTARYGATLETGVNLQPVKGLTLTPKVTLAYTNHNLSGLNEQGGAAALMIDSLSVERLDLRAGLQMSGTAKIGGWSLRPQVQASWVRNLHGANSGYNARFADAPDYMFVLPFANGDTSWGEVRGGLTLTNGNTSFGAGVEMFIDQSGFSNNRAMANYSIRF